jgi:hypothetical protein
MYGRGVRGVVDDGAIRGPLDVTSLVEAYVSGSVRVGLGPWTGAADLTDPIHARATVAAVFDDGAAFEGMPAPAQSVPGGVYS